MPRPMTRRPPRLDPTEPDEPEALREPLLLDGPFALREPARELPLRLLLELLLPPLALIPAPRFPPPPPPLLRLAIVILR
jgi:hypothetical protein